jgi:hypothetical protein
MCGDLPAHGARTDDDVPVRHRTASRGSPARSCASRAVPCA